MHCLYSTSGWKVEYQCTEQGDTSTYTLLRCFFMYSKVIFGLWEYLDLCWGAEINWSKCALDFAAFFSLLGYRGSWWEVDGVVLICFLVCTGWMAGCWDIDGALVIFSGAVCCAGWVGGVGWPWPTAFITVATACLLCVSSSGPLLCCCDMSDSHVRSTTSSFCMFFCLPPKMITDHQMLDNVIAYCIGRMWDVFVEDICIVSNPNFEWNWAHLKKKS